MLEVLELQDVGPAPHMRLELAPRLNLLTGDNSLGKSFALDCIWWMLTQRWATEMALPTQHGPEIKPELTGRWREQDRDVERRWVFDRHTWRWKLVQEAGAELSLLIQEETAYAHCPALYARVDGGFSVWDPLRNVQDVVVRAATTFERPVPLDLSAHHVWNGREVPVHALLPDGPQRVACNGLIRDWLTWRYQRRTVFEKFERVLEGLSPHPELERLSPGDAVRISPEEARDIPQVNLPYGPVPITLASAGLRRVLSLAYLLVWMWHEHTEAARLAGVSPARELIVLVDEIEAHLHPQWQRVILPAVFEVLGSLEPSWSVQMVATTHAPLVMASLEPLFDPRQDALWRLHLLQGTVALDREDWRRRGDANSWLISDIFDLAEPRSVRAERALQQAEALMSRKDPQLAEFTSVRQELRATLPDVDPFWIRWRFWAQQAGFTP